MLLLKIYFICLCNKQRGIMLMFVIVDVCGLWGKKANARRD